MSVTMLRNRARASSSDSLDVPVGDYGGDGQQPIAYRAPRRPSRGRSTSGASGAVAMILLLLVIATASGGGVFYYMKQQQEKLQGELSQTVQDEKALARSLEEEKHKLHQNLQNAQKSLESLRESEANRNRELEAGSQQHLKKIHQLVEYKNHLKSEMQKDARRRLIEKFGPGPHHLSIRLAFHPESNVARQPGGNRILIEMAPDNEMPTTVLWFLEAVERGLYNGASFHRNPGHVVQAGPIANFKTPPNTQLYQKFKESGFENLPFQEVCGCSNAVAFVRLKIIGRYRHLLRAL